MNEKKEKKSGNNHPFAVNEKRFAVKDNEVPAPGAYDLKSTVTVKNPNHKTSVYKSSTHNGIRDQDILIGKDNPGVGEYDHQNLNTLAYKEFQGGASNNFVLYTKQNY